MTEHEAAKPKRPRDLEFEDAPQQESIRGLSPRTIRRNPSTDQKRVRREMQRKTASQGDALASALQKEAGETPFGDWSCATPDCKNTDFLSALRGDKYCKSCMKAGEPDKQREAEQAKKRSSKTATQFDTQADKLNPGDMIRTPTGQTVKVLRMRNHETSGGHVYMDTDQGTSVVRRKSPVSIVPFNSQQQELPGYGTPGGNSNKLPMDSGNVGPSNQQPGGSNQAASTDCPVCGGKGTLHRQGQQYVCSKCGYRENFGAAGPGEGFNFTDMTQNLMGGGQGGNRGPRGPISSSLTRQSAIARRAQDVLETTKEIQ